MEQTKRKCHYTIFIDGSIKAFVIISAELKIITIGKEH
tara:strand:+ start:1982 stop:2095 length:114 start_codon:yes stop_codon:yes gene_type:complete